MMNRLCCCLVKFKDYEVKENYDVQDALLAKKNSSVRPLSMNNNIDRDEGVEVVAPANLPLGLLLQRSSRGSAMVEGFTPLPDGSMGVIECSKLVVHGSILAAINGVDVSHASLEQVLEILKQTSHLARLIRFQPPQLQQYDDL